MNNFGTLFNYEIKKLLKRKILWITLLICLIITGFSVVGSLTGTYYVDGVKADTHYNMFFTDLAYQKALDGREIGQTLLEEMSRAYGMIPPTAERYTTTEEYQKYARPYSEIFNFVRITANMTVSETLEWVPDEEDLYVRRLAMLEKTWQDTGLSDGEKSFWLQKDAEVETPFIFAVTEGYSALFRAFTSIGILVLLSVAVCISSVFPDEHTRKTDQLILCSTHGKDGAYWAKILAGVSFSLGLSLIVSAFAFTLAFCVYGAEGFSAAFQLIYVYCSYPLTVGKATLLMYGVLAASSVLFSIFVMVLSERLHGSIATLAAATGLLILGMVFSVPSQYRIPSQIWAWLPNCILSPQNLFDVRLLSVFGRYFTAWQAVPVIYFLAAFLLIIAGRAVYRHYQVSGR